MTESLTPRTARWLLAMIVLLILYGSLYPFELRAVHYPGFGELVRRLHWARTTRGDLFANVLLYLPFGAALAWSLPRSLGPVARLLVVTLCGAALSVSVELAQVFTRMRVSSLSDVASNTGGSVLGCAAALAIGAVATRLHASEALKLTREPVSAALVALWLASFLPPWLPPFDTSRWPAAWSRIVDAGWPEPQLVLIHALGWLVVAAALRALTRPQYVWGALVLIVSLTLVVRFTLFVRFAGAAEAAGALVALAAWPLVARLGERTLPLALFLGLLAAITWRGLAPFEFTSHARALRLVPFGDLISRGSTGFNLPLLFGKAFWYGALVWLLARRGTAPLGAGLFVAVWLATLELLQMWTPAGHHVPSSTDPVIALAAAMALALFGAIGAGDGGEAPEPAARKRKARRG